MSSQEEVSSQPLVIVRRRRGGEEEAHHGGVWKIAYADFMTAMMAFFLVMWLINAADKKTIVQVAAYFNPLRLTDRNATQKGLEDIDEAYASKPGGKKSKDDVKSKEKKQGSAAEPPDSKSADAEGAPLEDKAEATPETQDTKMFADPISKLDTLAEEAKSESVAAATSETPADVFRDPFDPAHPSIKPPVAKPADVKSKPTKAAQKNKPPIAPAEAKDIAQAAKQEEAISIETALKAAMSKVSTTIPGLEVKATPDGLLISIIDDANFGMFGVGSAEPKPQLVLMMESVAGILKPKTGKIVIRGHTDGRAYKKGGYDNWRLSSARAQMAYYMLLRGGIPETSFEAIEGRADRDLKLPQDKDAPQNRRIDILVRDDKP